MDENSTLKKFSSSYEETPSFEVWKNVSNKLDALEKRKRRGVAWFIFGGVFIAGLLGWFVIKQPLKHEGQQQQQVNNNSSISGITENQNNSTASIQNKNNTNNNFNRQNQEQNPVAVKTRKNKTKQNINSTAPKSTQEYSIQKQNQIATEKENGVTQSEEIRTNRSFEPVIFASTIDVPPLSHTTFHIEPTERKFIQAKHTLSRWSLRFTAGWNKSGKQGEKASQETEINEKALNAASFSLGLTYDINSRFRIFSGFLYSKTGMITERSQIKLVEPTPGTTIYTIPTTAGELNGPPRSFDDLYYNSADSTLFPFTNSAMASVNDSIKTKDFVLKTEFYYLSIPVHVIYHLSERRITPFVAGGFTTGYLISDQRMLNGQKFPYDYETPLRNWQFSADVSAGIYIQLSSRFNFEIGSGYSHSFVSVSQEGEWVPYSVGVFGGMSWRFMKCNTHAKF